MRGLFYVPKCPDVFEYSKNRIGPNQERGIFYNLAETTTDEDFNDLEPLGRWNLFISTVYNENRCKRVRYNGVRINFSMLQRPAGTPLEVATLAGGLVRGISAGGAGRIW